MLLDVQLGESCFERVARTGIALSVWEDVVGPEWGSGRCGCCRWGWGWEGESLYDSGIFKCLYFENTILTVDADEK